MDWGPLFSAFGLIFVAELGDKTQLAVVTQTCKYRRPWAVFLGASLALTIVTALSAAGGQLLGQVIPESALRTIASLAFVAMGVLIGREAVRAQATGPDLETCDQPDDVPGNRVLVPSSNWKAFGSTLGLLFLAELGDKTQLAVLSLAGKQNNPWPVFLGGTLGLATVTALGVIGGQGLCQLIPERLLLWVSSAAFVVLGVLIWFGVP